MSAGTLQQAALIGEISLPQRRDVPGGLRRGIRILQADLRERRRPRLRHANPGSSRRAAIQTQRLSCSWRQPQPGGERSEDRIFRRPVLARLVVTQPVLMQTGNAGNLPLRNTILIKHRDDEQSRTSVW